VLEHTDHLGVHFVMGDGVRDQGVVTIAAKSSRCVGYISGGRGEHSGDTHQTTCPLSVSLCTVCATLWLVK